MATIDVAALIDQQKVSRFQVSLPGVWADDVRHWFPAIDGLQYITEPPANYRSRNP